MGSFRQRGFQKAFEPSYLGDWGSRAVLKWQGFGSTRRLEGTRALYHEDWCVLVNANELESPGGLQKAALHGSVA